MNFQLLFCVQYTFLLTYVHVANIDNVIGYDVPFFFKFLCMSEETFKIIP